MTKKHDLVVIGGGAGGLVVASVAAQLGLDVVLINRQEAMGGDCLHYGCVPSKALLQSAAVAHTMSHADRWGISAVDPRPDMKSVNRAIHNAIETIQPHDSRERFENLGCEVVTGEARFTAPSQVEVEGRLFNAKRFVIATGSSASIPPVTGIEQVGYVTNEDMFSLPAVPESIAILGGGPVGVEMAQAYSRLGSRVSIVEMAPHLLPQMDKGISRVLADELSAEGISVYLNAEVVEVFEQAGIKHVCLKEGDTLQSEMLLVAAGRKPALNALDLAKANVSFDAKGIKVNNRMQTSNRRIYACGDVTGVMPLTHVAELQAGIIIANMIFRLPRKINYDVIPSVVYTQPEVAQVGISVEQCSKLKHGEIHQFSYSQLDRAITDNKKAGIAKILINRGRIAGAHIVGEHAGELIHELALAVQQRMKVSKIASLVHAYPAYSQLNKRLVGQYYSERFFSPLTKKIVAILNRFSS
jgi:pyruvate/2-oxoglutarate dehydrogenase complex dihydrolipoamide dehydrogenase (E3) component